MRHKHTHTYVCYLLFHEPKQKVYTGITNQLQRRLRQHNGALVGGSKYTARFRPWRIVCYITGFQNHREVLRYEWRCKRARPAATRHMRGSPLVRALSRFRDTCQSTAWWLAGRTNNHSLRAHFVFQGPERSLLHTFDANTQPWPSTLSRLPLGVLRIILEDFLSHGAHYAALCRVPQPHIFACKCCGICALCHSG